MSEVGTQRLAEAVRTFYYAECAKSSTHSALPSKERGAAGKAKPKTDDSVCPATPEEIRSPESQKAARGFVPLRTYVTRFSNEKGDLIAISGKVASAMSKEQEVERSMLWEKIPGKHRKVLERSWADAAADEEFLKSHANPAKDAAELAAQMGLPAGRSEWIAQITSKQPSLNRVNVVDFTTYASLKKAGRLSDPVHAVAFLRALTRLVENVGPEYKLSDDFPTNLAATKQQMQIAVDTLPLWPKVRVWGRNHPKVLQLQFTLDGGSEKALELLESLSSLPIMTSSGGPLSLPQKPNNGDAPAKQEFPIVEKKEEVAAVSADKTSGTHPTPVAKTPAKPPPIPAVQEQSIPGARDSKVKRPKSPIPRSGGVTS